MGSGDQNPTPSSIVSGLFNEVKIEPNKPDPKTQVAAAALSAAQLPEKLGDKAPPLPLRHQGLGL